MASIAALLFRRGNQAAAYERRLAQEWVKRRLAAVFPELRGDPRALDRAYAELGLEKDGDASFQMRTPRGAA